MDKSFICRALALAITALLGGCYESNVKVLNYGDQANLSGSYSCSSSSDQFPDDTVTIKEFVSGSGDKIDYRYQVVGGGRFRFTEMNTGMMLGQTQRGNQGWGRRERDARYGYVFVDVRGASGFSIHEVNFENMADIKKSAELNNVSHKKNEYGRTPTRTLSGSADEIFEFFNSHRRYMLQETASCSRAD